MTLLSLQNLCLSFADKRVVNNVSLEIRAGEMLALVGESGSGKSLTALACMGLQPPSAALSGSIRFEDRETAGASENTLRAIRGKRISMIFQEPMTALNPLHTIGRQITEMWKGDDRIIESSNHPIISLLDQVGLSHFKDRLDTYPHQLSGGERQRVMIAMAIANDPALLIADEPTTAVDVTIQKKILQLLKHLQQERGMAMLFITHDLTVVKRLADRVAVMKAGEIVELGRVADVFAAPKHPYTQLLLSSEPKGGAVPLPPPPVGGRSGGGHTSIDLASSPPPQPSPYGGGSLLSCTNLRVHFPIKKGLLRRTVGYVKAVDGVSLSLAEGETIGIVGESGSGKTTLAFALLKLLKSDGEIHFTPTPNPQLPTPNLRRHMQLVFQDPYSSLNPRMTIEQIIGEGLDVHFSDKNPEEKSAMIEDILREVGLDPAMRHRFAHEFSGGQRQRISIARAMVLRPKLVVLDEPTSALDLTIQSQILELLKSLQAKYRMSYLFISHDLRVIRAIAHRIMVMRNGVVVETGETRQILESPKEDYTKTLIEAAFLK